jgi:hypothetical protein
LLSYLFQMPLSLIGIIYIVIMITATEVGYRIGVKEKHRGSLSKEAMEGIGFIATGMFTLMAFALGFSISMAENRFEERRNLVRDEANAIGTTYLRAQAIGGSHGAEVQRLLREYTELRIQYVRGPAGTGNEPKIVERTDFLQKKIWNIAGEVMKRDSGPLAMIFMQSLNQMIDLSLSQRRAFEAKVPLGILKLVMFASLLSLGVMGYYFGLSGRRHLILTSLLFMVWCASVLLTIDLDRPREGVIAIDPAPLIWTLQGFGSGS